MSLMTLTSVVIHCIIYTCAFPAVTCRFHFENAVVVISSSKHAHMKKHNLCLNNQGNPPEQVTDTKLLGDYP